MKRTLSFLLLVAAASTFSAAAASLHVDAGVLHAWSFDVDVCADQPGLCEQPAPLVTITFLDVLFNPGGQAPRGEQPDARSIEVFVGDTYEVKPYSFDRYNIIACPSSYTPPQDDAVTYRFDTAGSTLTAQSDVTQVLCYQQRTGSRGDDATTDETSGEPSSSLSEESLLVSADEQDEDVGTGQPADSAAWAEATAQYSDEESG
jgi:hypothetical protein